MNRSVRILVTLAGLVALTVGTAVAVYWAPDRPVADLAARWAPAPSVFLDVDGLRAHVRDEGPRGDPMPLVLLHGTAASLHTWDGWTTTLIRERRVIRVDLPGFGLTGPAPDGDYRIERYVRFVTALLDALRLERCVLAGNSFGGWTAWETALALPDRVGALVLVDAAGYPLESESVPIGFRIARIPGLNRLARVTLPRSLIESSVRNTYGDPSRVTPAVVDRYYELTLREGNRAALARRFAAGRYSDDPARIRTLQLPTLILWGGHDRLIPPRYGQRFHLDIQGSRLVTFPALGHVPQEEDPPATVAVVRGFLAQIAAGTPAPLQTDGGSPMNDLCPVGPDEVLQFWFEALTPSDWWRKDPALDCEIAARFAPTLAAAARCELFRWRATAPGRLAEVIVLDQFPRNIHRDTAAAFANDALALALAQEAVARGSDRELPVPRRAFLYLPWMHSESRTIHEEALRLFAEPGLEHNLEFERQHKAIIDRFGRYPHRNAALGRASTPEELAFLREPGSAF